MIFNQAIFCQNIFTSYNNERVAITKNAMIVLGAWGTANAVTGAVGLSSSHGEAKYFHQMNLIWGVTNLAIALPTYLSLKGKAKDLSLSETVKAQSGIEKTFFLNMGLDLVYIAAGAYCVEKGNNDSKHDLYKGYGKSLFLQGGGLLIFDVTMSLININHGKKLYKLLNSLQFSGNSAAIFWKL